MCMTLASTSRGLSHGLFRGLGRQRRYQQGTPGMLLFLIGALLCYPSFAQTFLLPVATHKDGAQHKQIEDL